MLLLVAAPCRLPAQKLAAASEEEQFFFDSANRERVTHQLAPLKWDSALAEAARRHALLMSDERSLSHQLPGEPRVDQRAVQAGARFSQVGENIAMGREPAAIHTGWMHSPGHRANILNAHFTALGVGVIEDDGALYAVEDFSVAIANMTIEAQEGKVATLLAAKGLRVSNVRRELARNVCSDERTPTGPMLIMSYETPDISELPEPLVAKIRDSKYREADVGACQPKDSADGFARFRITVLLFGARKEAAKK